MSVRYRPASKVPGSENLRPLQKGHKKLAGRQKGVPNKITSSVKEAFLEAAKLLGSDDKGKGELIGYCSSVMLDRDRGARILEKILPTQITGPGDGPVRILSLPPEALKNATPDELKVMETFLARMASGGTAQEPQGGAEVDGSAYAAAVGATKH